MGWKLSVPSISRKTQKGLPRYHAKKEDTFILAGAEDLVPVLPEEEDGGNGEFEIKRYRPRSEDSFARIEQWRNKTTGEIHKDSPDVESVITPLGGTTCLSK